MTPDDHRSDELLIERAGKGDEGAFEALYLRHRGYVLSLAARFGLPADDAQDVLQEVFMKVLGLLPGLTLTAKFTTFLYPVVKHLCIRRRRRDSRLVLFPDPSSMSDLFPVVPGGEPDLASVAHTIAGLPDHHREVLVLRFVDEFSLEEIAQALLIPLGTVKSRLHNALNSLRRELLSGRKKS